MENAFQNWIFDFEHDATIRYFGHEIVVYKRTTFTYDGVTPLYTHYVSAVDNVGVRLSCKELASTNREYVIQEAKDYIDSLKGAKQVKVDYSDLVHNLSNLLSKNSDKTLTNCQLCGNQFIPNTPTQLICFRCRDKWGKLNDK